MAFYVFDVPISPFAGAMEFYFQCKYMSDDRMSEQSTNQFYLCITVFGECLLIRIVQTVHIGDCLQLELTEGLVDDV